MMTRILFFNPNGMPSMDPPKREVAMRNVSFVDHFDVEFKGNVISQTILLADVDNDMANELIVGNIDGQIAVFKGDATYQPWKKISLTGMLTCFSVGEIFTGKKNSLVCMTAEGWCYVYHFTALSSSLPLMYGEEGTERAVLTQELPANAKVMFLADIDKDGHVEMVVGYSDRIVRAFRWHESLDCPGGHFVLLQKWQLAGQIGSITANFNSLGQLELLVSQPGAAFVSLKVKPSFRQVRSEGQINSKMSGLRLGHPFLERSGSFAETGRHSSSSKLNLSAQSIDLAGIRDSPAPTNQSDTVSIHSDISYRSLENINFKGVEGARRTSRPELQKSVSDADRPDSRKGSGQMECSSEEDLVNSVASKMAAQNCSTEKLERSVKTTAADLTDTSVKKLRARLSNEHDVSLDSEDVSIVYHPFENHTTRNEDSSTFMIGSIKRSQILNGAGTSGFDAADMATYYAMATLDGSFLLGDNDQIVWSLQVNHELVAVAKLDVTGDGNEEVIGCSWNGHTYIINHKKEIVCYNFPDSVAAFCAGLYSVNERQNVPCLVYATTSNHIYIYYNISLPHLESTNLIHTMASKPATANLLNTLQIKEDDYSSLRQLYHWALYGQHGAS